MREKFPSQENTQISSDKTFKAVRVPEKKEDPEIGRLFEVLQKYWHREREQEPEKRDFKQVLDEIEVSGSISESRAETMEDAQRSLADFHNDFQKIEKICSTNPEELAPKGLIEILEYEKTIKKIIYRLEYCWRKSVGEHLCRKEEKENRIIHQNEEYGTYISNVHEFLQQPAEAREQLLTDNPELNVAFQRFQIGYFQNLENKIQEIQEHIENRTQTNPEEIRRLIKQIDLSDEKVLDEWQIDALLGIKIENTESKVNREELSRKYGYEQYGYQGTPYKLIKSFLQELQLSADDTLYDLGSGYGRIPIYGGITTQAHFKGIEIVPERVEESNAIKERMKLNNVEFQRGNVLEHDYSDGSVFFLFNPFSFETLERVGDNLRTIATKKKIRVVSLGPSTSYFDKQDWVKPIESESKEHSWGLKIYESI